jgi:S1-C subfamily serine protease
MQEDPNHMPQVDTRNMRSFGMRHLIAIAIGIGLVFTLVGCGSHAMTIKYLGPEVNPKSKWSGMQVRLDIDDRAGKLMRVGRRSTEYIKTIMDRPRKEVIEGSVAEALQAQGAIVQSGASTELNVIILQFQGEIGMAGLGQEGVVSVSLGGRLTRNGRELVPAQEAFATEEVSLGPFTLPWNSMKPLFDRCLTRSVNALVAELSDDMSRGTASERNPSSSGTCFAVAPDGWLVTADHVVDSGGAIEVQFGSLMVSATLVVRDKVHDLALLHVAIPTPDYISLSGDTDIAIGQSVYTLGYPLRGVLTEDIRFTDGTISATSGMSSEDGLYQVSVPVQPGNSGGPLLTKEGLLLGVVVSRAADLAIWERTGTLPENISFAIKSEFLLDLLKTASVTIPDRRSIPITDACKAVHSVISN